MTEKGDSNTGTNIKTADFVLELLCEEIPARMQKNAQQQLQTIAQQWLQQHDLSYAKIESFVTPRRMSLLIANLPLHTAAKTEEKRGPRVGASQQALDGFLKSTGLSLSELEERDTGKGIFYMAVTWVQAKPTETLLYQFVDHLLATFKWPKSMRWGTESFKWVRPLKQILAVFDGNALNNKITIGDKKFPFTNTTFGHPVMAPEPIQVTSITDYKNSLKKAFVILDSKQRQQIIQQFKAPDNTTVYENKNLLQEVAGLCEYPVPVLGDIEPQFVEQLPEKLLILTMAYHQKYFSIYNNGKQLAPYFLTVADMQATDNNAAIKAGNERVLRARLHDALFLYNQDIKTPLQDFNKKLEKVTFHQKLGSVAERVKRITAIAQHINPEAKTAAQLCKADLVSGTVNEFPELQGYIGQCCALQQNLPNVTAEAIGQHYLPTGNDSTLPNTPVAQAVALADKLEILTSFFSINEKPTGSKDPYALRRAAYGILRILAIGDYEYSVEKLLTFTQHNAATQQDVAQFIRERCLQWLKDQGTSHDVVTAADLPKTDNCHPLIWLDKAKQFANLKNNTRALPFIESVKRLNNIVKTEEKKDSTTFKITINIDALQQDDKAFYEQCLDILNNAQGDSFESLFPMAEYINNYLETTHVNADDKALRLQRLQILTGVRDQIAERGNFVALQV